MTWQGKRRADLPRNWSSSIVPRVLERDRQCQLGLPGCTRIATEVDHKGASTDHRLSMLRGVCHPCHAKRTAQQAADAKPKTQRDKPPHPGLI